jgi:hypothetical protein
MDAEFIPGAPFHGEFSSANASAPANEPAARIKLYPAGSAVEITTLGINDQVIITDVQIQCASSITASIFFGADENVGAGELVGKYGFAPTGTSNIGLGCNVPHKGPAQGSGGAGIPWPKIKTSGAGQIDVVIRGTIYRQD